MPRRRVRHGVRRPQRIPARPGGHQADPRGAGPPPPSTRDRLPGRHSRSSAWRTRPTCSPSTTFARCSEATCTSSSAAPARSPSTSSRVVPPRPGDDPRRPDSGIADFGRRRDQDHRADRPARGGRGRADRQVRQPHPPPGPSGTRFGHPHRADCRRPAHPVPDRRRAPRGDPVAEGDPGGRHDPPQGHGQPRHRRASRAPGRSDHFERRPPRNRPTGRDASDGARREGRASRARQVERVAQSRRARFPAVGRRSATRSRIGRPTARFSSPDRPDRASRPLCTRP